MSNDESESGAITTDGGFGVRMYVKGRRLIDLAVTVAGGSGSLSYKFQLAFDPSPSPLKYDIFEGANTDVEQTANGVFHHRIDTGDAHSLWLVGVDIVNGGYTISGKAHKYMEIG